MDIESLAKQLILQNMTPEQQMAVLDGIKASVAQAKEVQKRKIGENVDLVVQALKKIEADIRDRYDAVGNAIERRVASIQDGRDGADGRDGRDGKDGKPGKDGAAGRPGRDGKDGKDGRDGIDGISVISANIDFDGSLVIKLSNGKEINVGEVVPMDLAERIKIIGNGGGTSQTVLDTLDSLQSQIDSLIPSQTGNSGKYLTTNGSVLSWASVAGALSYQGTWNASTNSPTLASSTGTNGYYYIVSTSGSTNLDGITDWVVGDWLLFNGTVWQKIDQSNLVTSVNGQTGAVSLTTSNISEGSNLYYTDARARSALSAGTGISYNSTTGVITNSAPDQTVALTGSGTVSISGTYPNFTITGADQYQGTVTSVAMTVPTGLSVSGTPITSSGTLAVTFATGYSIPTNTSQANWDTAYTDRLKWDGGSTGLDAATGRTSLGLGTIATQAASNVSITGGSITGITDLAVADGGTGLSSYTAGDLLYYSSGTALSKLGIGTSNTVLTSSGSAPQWSTSLTLSGSVTATTLIPSGSSAPTNGVYLPAANSVGIATNSTNAIYINSSQNVGIGTSSPNVGYKLTVAEKVIIASNADVTPDANWKGQVTISGNGYSGGLSMDASGIWLGNNSASRAVIFATNETECARIDGSGNVGIGTSSPGNRLHVVAGDNVTNTRLSGASYALRVQSIASTGTVVDATNNTEATYQPLLIGGSEVRFTTSGTERARIDSSGNVGIGTSSPVAALSVAKQTTALSGTSQPYGVHIYPTSSGLCYIDALTSSTSNTSLALRTYNNGTYNEVRIDSSGNLLVGYTSSNGSYKLQVNSQIFATSSTIATSDAKYKENITSIDDALALVNALNPVQFSWKQHPVHNFDRTQPTVGFIAQEVQQVLAKKPYVNSIVKRNECVIKAEEKDAEGNVTKPAVTEEFLGIAEGNMIALLTKAIQEQQALITQLTERIAALEKA